MIKIEGNSRIELAIRELQKDSHPPAALPIEEMQAQIAALQQEVAELKRPRPSLWRRLMDCDTPYV